MAADAPSGLDTIVTGSSNMSLMKTAPPLNKTDSQSSSSDQSNASSLYSSSSQNGLFNNNAPVTARRFVTQ